MIPNMPQNLQRNGLKIMVLVLSIGQEFVEYIEG